MVTSKPLWKPRILSNLLRLPQVPAIMLHHQRQPRTQRHLDDEPANTPGNCGSSDFAFPKCNPFVLIAKARISPARPSYTPPSSSPTHSPAEAHNTSQTTNLLTTSGHSLEKRRIPATSRLGGLTEVSAPILLAQNKRTASTANTRELRISCETVRDRWR